MRVKFDKSIALSYNCIEREVYFMATKLFQKRIDENLLKDVSELYASLGTSVGEAVVMFLKKSQEVGGLPFELKHSNDYLMENAVNHYLSKRPSKHYDLSKQEDREELFDGWDEW